jgi:hypothetical protein
MLSDMKRIGVSILLVVTLVVYALPNATAVVTPGSKCSKVGAQQTYKSKIYTCVKSGVKLVWNNGTNIISAKPSLQKSSTPTAPSKPTNGPSPSPKLQNCIPTINCPLGSVGPGGGLVFFDSGSQQSWGRYLEVSPSVWANDRRQHTSVWCDKKNPTLELQREWTDLSIGDENHRNLGTGRKYSEFILKQCANSAARVASLFRGGGKTDWYLPSSSELLKLYEFVQKASNPDLKLKEMGIDKYWYYWSSALMSGPLGWGEALRFVDGPVTNAMWSYDEGYIRPVRSF